MNEADKLNAGDILREVIILARGKSSDRAIERMAEALSQARREVLESKEVQGIFDLAESYLISGNGPDDQNEFYCPYHSCKVHDEDCTQLKHTESCAGYKKLSAFERMKVGLR
jgi:hypothetical protein